MMRYRKWTLVVVVAAAGSWALAQSSSPGEPAPSGPAAPAQVTAAPPATQPAPTHRDPTRVNPKLRRFLVSGRASSAKAQSRPALPKITRRAFIQTDHHEPEALISVAGDAALLPISAGSTLTLPSTRGQTVTVHVTKLSAEAIEIDVPATGEKVTIR